MSKKILSLLFVFVLGVSVAAFADTEEVITSDGTATYTTTLMDQDLLGWEYNYRQETSINATFSQNTLVFHYMRLYNGWTSDGKGEHGWLTIIDSIDNSRNIYITKFHGLHIVGTDLKVDEDQDNNKIYWTTLQYADKKWVYTEHNIHSTFAADDVSTIDHVRYLAY
jgi:hypothetical protein